MTVFNREDGEYFRSALALRRAADLLLRAQRLV
jgi:hypothetical protein